MLFLRRIVNFFRREKLDRDIEAELRAHLEMRTADNLASGMSPEAARQDAAIRFGNMLAVREATLSVKIAQWFDDLRRDTIYALRQIRHSPGFAVTATLTLALAIMTNVVAFGVLDALALEPLIPHGSDRLFNVVQGPHGYENQSYPDYVDYRDANTTFTALAAYRTNQVGLTHANAAYKCWDFEVSGNYFDLLGVKPALGRFFHSADEHGPDSAPYVVLSDFFWRQHFKADPHIVGTMVRLNQHPFTVLGISPASFHGTERFIWPDVWVPMVNERQLEGYDFLNRRFNHGIWLLGMLKPGVSVAQATANLNAIANRLAKLYPSSDDGMKARLVEPGLIGDQIGDPARAFLSGIMSLALLVFLAACANLAGIFAARAADRQRELGVRLSIGASRWRLVRQLLSEALLISFIGGAAGTLLAAVLLRFLTDWRPFAIPVSVAVTPGFRVYLVALLFSVAGGILPGLLPARQLWRTDLVGAVKSAAMRNAGRGFRTLDVLLGIQIALCALLLTCALVGLRGMERSLHAPIGFQPEGVVLAEADAHMAGYDDAGTLNFQKRVSGEAARIPGVVAVGIIDEPPLGTGGSGGPVYPAETTDFRPSSSKFGASFFSVSPGYFKAAGTRLLTGRDFTWHDAKGSPNVAIVNERFATLLFGTSNPLGRRFKTSATDTYQVIGVVEAGKYGSLTEDPTAAMFFPSAQSTSSDTVLVVRSTVPPSQIAAALNDLLPKLDPKLPFTIRTWPEELGLVLFPARVATATLGVMGLLAAMLALTGVFGTAAYSVSKRKKEFGIRIALGSRASQLIGAALGRPVLLLIAGSATGLLLGLLTTPLLATIVYQASPRDPLVWAGVVAAMVCLGTAATWVPARRALRVNPMQLLREQG